MKQRMERLGDTALALFSSLTDMRRLFAFA
jgi:hypothetical protein